MADVLGSAATDDPFFRRVDEIERHLLDHVANWQITFPEGNTGVVCGVRDAAVIVAKMEGADGDFSHLLEAPRFEGVGHDLNRRWWGGRKR